MGKGVRRLMRVLTLGAFSSADFAAAAAPAEAGCWPLRIPLMNL